MALAPAPVLVDPSGRRMRALALGGRAFAILLLLWLAGLVLAGLGILPAGEVPLGRALAGQAPSPLGALPRVQQPSALDLAPAEPLRLTAAGVSLRPRTARRAGAGSHGASPGHRAGLSARGVTRHHRSGSSRRGGRPAQTPASTSAHGGTGAPGQTRKLATPGHTKTSAPGRSGSAPGRVGPTTTTSSPGHPGSRPGRTVAHGFGHGNAG